MNTNDVREKVNPVFNTAKMTLYWLAESGNEMAREYLEYMDFDEAAIPENMVATPEMKLSNVISLDERHNTMNYMIHKMGYGNLLDLACGFTPRGVAMSMEGMNYVGGDLPATISGIAPMAQHFYEKYSALQNNRQMTPGIMEYKEVDITNYASVKEAADLLPGELCIVTEGLLMYLTKNEKREVCQNLRKILSEHGGCWITQDNEAAAQYFAINTAMFGPDFMKEILKAKDNYASKSDVDISANSFKTIDEAIAFFQAEGLLVERIPFYSEEIELHSLKQLSPEVEEDMIKRLSQCMIWIITADPQYNDQASLDAKAGNSVDPEQFDISLDIKDNAEKSEKALFVQVCGRLDTLTSPELITAFENVTEGQTYGDIYVDLTHTQYISSAGLRVLLMMKKSSGGRELFISGASDEVREVFDMTGFADIFTIV